MVQKLCYTRKANKVGEKQHVCVPVNRILEVSFDLKKGNKSFTLSSPFLKAFLSRGRRSSLGKLGRVIALPTCLHFASLFQDPNFFRSFRNTSALFGKKSRRPPLGRNLITIPIRLPSSRRIIYLFIHRTGKNSIRTYNTN